MLFPELAHFPTRRERTRALNAAFASIPGLLVLVLLILFASAAAAFALDLAVLRPLRFSSGLEWLAILAILFFATVASSTLLVRGYVRRQLRIQLKSLQRIDLCIACGFNLENLAYGRCPKCNAHRGEAARVRYPLAIRGVLWAGLAFAIVQSIGLCMRVDPRHFEWTVAAGLVFWPWVAVVCWKYLHPVE